MCYLNKKGEKTTYETWKKEIASLWYCVGCDELLEKEIFGSVNLCDGCHRERLEKQPISQLNRMEV